MTRRRLARLALMLMAVLVAGCADQPQPPATAFAPATASPANTPAPAETAAATPARTEVPPPVTPPPGATPVPIPDWAIDLESALECSAAPAPVGYERDYTTGPRFATVGTPSPYPFIDDVTHVDLPATGWENDPPVPDDPNASIVRWVNRVHGRIKAVIIMEGTSIVRGHGRWTVTGFRTCQPDEFDPARGRTTDNSPWVDALGQRTDLVQARTGPAHCGWESMIWLRYHEDSLYLRDPLGVFADVTAGRFRTRETLPADARPTGLHTDRFELYETPDRDEVWVRHDGRFERWPRARREIGCM